MHRVGRGSYGSENRIDVGVVEPSRCFDRPHALNPILHGRYSFPVAAEQERLRPLCEPDAPQTRRRVVQSMLKCSSRGRWVKRVASRGNTVYLSLVLNYRR